MIRGQLFIPLHDELIVDNFAGGGGASIGIELATGRPVDIAINHDAQAVAMHQANHPQTRHYCESVWDVDPREVTQGRPVGLAWFSPDCKHFSKAKGGKPVEKKIRGLAWVVLRWVGTLKPTNQHPRVIILENVEEFVTWGPLVDGRPCPKRKGQTFRAFVNALRRCGYAVEWRELRACDYGAPTTRKRLFLIARRDGRPIIWPEPTHCDPKQLPQKTRQLAETGIPVSGLKPWRTAAECIDWSIACPSIFDRAKPLAEATQRRIAKGIKKFVIDSADPFIVKLTHKYEWFRGQTIEEPLHTITGKNPYGLVSPTLVQTGYGERDGQAPRVPGLEKPLGTVVAGGQKHALVSAFLARQMGRSNAADIQKPAPTVMPKGYGKIQLVTSNLVKLRGTNTGSRTDEPIPTITAGGTHIGEVRAFLTKYYGIGGGQDPREPMHTVTSKDRLGLVTVAGQDYVINDIGMRMLAPHELFRAQGFPAEYQIDPVVNGKPLSKAAQVRMCGNSVSPPVAMALVVENYAKNVQANREVAL